MHSSPNKEVVEPSWEVLLIEKKLDHQPGQPHKHIDPDGIIAENGKDERDGAQFEGAVEEEDRTKAKKPPDLLAWAESMPLSVQQKAFYPRPHQEEEGPKSSHVLKRGWMAICLQEEDKELEEVLEVSIEEPLCNANLASEDGPVVLEK